jgi:hypothetical protein
MNLAPGRQSGLDSPPNLELLRAYQSIAGRAGDCERLTELMSLSRKSTDSETEAMGRMEGEFVL